MKSVGSRANITIVGAGQAGLSLGIGLIRFGFEVNIISDRTADEIRTGRVMSSQCMFDTAQGFERALGLNYWDKQCPPVNGMRFDVFLPEYPGTPVTTWSAPFDRPARSVDQRMKMPRWMEEFERLGGALTIETATVESLERYARESDLVIVAAGKGAITSLFETDTHSSPYQEPQRSLAMFYVRGLERSMCANYIDFSLIPGIGEYLTYPALTEHGECDIMLFEAVPGRSMDIWSPANSAEAQLALAQAFLEEHLPREARRAANVQLVDENAVLAGSVTPRVRKPIATLPSGVEVHAAIVGEAASLVTNWGSAGVGFINADLTLTLARMPVGTDLGIETDNHLSAEGVATGSAVLYDREGPVGMCVVTAVSNAARQIDLAQPLESITG